MGNNPLIQNPFGVLTFIVAPAILTNATSVLAMSTINRMLRTRDRMHELYVESQNSAQPQGEKFVAKVNRVEKQALILLTALRWIYLALGSFAAATLVTLLGAVAGEVGAQTVREIAVTMGMLFGFVGVSGVVGGCVHLFHATQISLLNIGEEAEQIRMRQKQLPAREASDGHP